MTMPVENDLLIPHEVATLLRVKVGWVYAHADELGALRVGKYLRFRWAHVLACVAEGSCQRRPHSRVGAACPNYRSQRQQDQTLGKA
jgi:hypothetical protein